MDITIAYDSQAAALMVNSPCAPTDKYHWWLEARAAQRALRARHVAILFVWVPAHGKKPDYRCKSDIDTATLRRLNAAADEGATIALDKALRENGGGAYAAALATTRARSLQLFGYAALVASIVERHWAA